MYKYCFCETELLSLHTKKKIVVFYLKNMENRTELEKKWYELHIEIVNKLIAFCKENNLKDVTDINLGIDGVKFSVESGEWTAATDSFLTAMEINRMGDEEPKMILRSY